MIVSPLAENGKNSNNWLSNDEDKESLNLINSRIVSGIVSRVISDIVFLDA